MKLSADTVVELVKDIEPTIEKLPWLTVKRVLEEYIDEAKEKLIKQLLSFLHFLFNS